MKRNHIVAIILALPILALLFWFFSVQEKISKSPTVRVAVTGYDPRDLLSGHYVVLRILWDKTDCAQFREGVCPRYDFDYNYRFYLPENDAKYLDRVIPRSANLEMELEFAMPKLAKPMIKELYIEGLTWKNWLDKNPEPLDM